MDAYKLNAILDYRHAIEKEAYDKQQEENGTKS